MNRPWLSALVLAIPALLGAQRVAPDSALSRCLGCGGPKHFGLALGEVLTDEMIPYTWNRWVKHKPWARTDLQSWENNLEYGWEWDSDHFGANQFSHPYSGNLYFSAARSNGYTFWEAAPFSMAGSAMWEYFGERNRPSINDLANTTLGGITLGETTYRLSSLLLDTRSTGAKRVFGELGAAIVNPVRAFSRLVSGDVGRVSDNPVDRLPSNVRGSLALGYQRVDSGGGSDVKRGRNQAFTFFTLGYGDPLAGDVTHPFGAFRLEAALATPGPGMLSQLRVGGALAVHDLKNADRVHHQLMFAMHYHYYNNAAFESGGQGFSGALVSRYAMGQHSSLRTEVWLTGFVLAAIKSDYSADSVSLATEKARNYDYGPGAGGRVLARYEHGDRWFLDVAYQGFFIGVVSGTAQQHFYHTASSELQVRLHGHLAVGQRDFVFYRTSHYAAHPTTSSRDVQGQVYLAWVF
jgi:hypothetical protein